MTGHQIDLSETRYQRLAREQLERQNARAERHAQEQVARERAARRQRKLNRAASRERKALNWLISDHNHEMDY